MQVEAHFENISEHIRQEISNAGKSVIIAVAWITSKRLFNELVLKAKEGCNITVIISNDVINRNSGIDFNEIKIGNSRVYKVGNGASDLMHNKFCVIDYSTVITGSYNWSSKAETNFENIIIIRGDYGLAEQFMLEFNNIRSVYYPEDVPVESEFPLHIIIKRLNILKNHIELRDIEDIQKEVFKLKALDRSSELAEIIQLIQKNDFNNALNKIEFFLIQNSKLNVWIDPAITALKFEMRVLENQITAFDNEIAEMEKLLADFHHRHTIELGDLILEILKVKKQLYKSADEKYKDAESDEREYKKQFQSEKEKVVLELDDEQKLELKAKFRKATILCNPDKVSEKLKVAAERVFVDLRKAYELNDLNRVGEILDDLEKGTLFTKKSETENEHEIMIATLERLRRQVLNLESQILAIRNSDTYKMVSSIPHWDDYFKRTKEKLEFELVYLKEKLEKDSLKHI